MGINSRPPSSTGQRSRLSETELRRLLVENLESLRRFCFSLTGSGSDGDDLAQSTVERLLNKGIPTEVAFTAWMFKVCKNIWIDQLRVRSRTQSADFEEIERNLEPVDGSAVAMGKAELQEVTTAIRQLDPDQRAVLGLVTVEGYSYREAAEILEVPIGTVMSRLARARRKLLDLMQEDS